MSIKVVYNTCYGGFSISRACAERMAQLGNQEAISMLAEEEFFGHLYKTSRHDQTLIQAIEELGKLANGRAANLEIFSLRGQRYIVREYDGLETIVEPNDIDWITVF